MIYLDDIKAHLCSYDPYELTGFPMLCPSDEYDREAEDIYERLKQKEEPTVENAEKIIREVFERSFGKIEMSKLALFCLARSIIDNDVHICPVCRENYFDERGSFDICPVCGWEDDNIQYNDHLYCGGANHLNVKISQMEQFLLHEDCTAKEFKALAHWYDEECRKIYRIIYP